MKRLILIFMIIHQTLHSQTTDTTYIQPYPFKGTIYSYLTNKNAQISYINAEKKYSLNYYPNTWGSFGIGASYQWIDLSLGLFNYGIRNESEYGKTSRLDLQSHFYIKQYILDAFLQAYQSFYSNSIYVTNENQPVYLRPDITFFHLGTNILRIFKHDKFSIKAAFSPSTEQKKSIGTFVIGGKFNIFSVSSDSVLNSSMTNTIFPSDFQLLSFSSLLIGVQFGYMYNYRYKNWLFHFTFIAGLATQLQQKQISSTPNRYYPHSTTGIIGNGRLSIMYNKERFYLILSAIADNCQYPLNKSIRLEHNFGRADITFGYRTFKKTHKHQ